ncbi:MAG TPA: 6-phosphofructokinase [Bacteroidia bacterium]|nr:6-phosphofructokinase [Bacteroidia bacterium]
MTKMKTIGVFTSGGDSPGMNACIRAVVRTAIYEGLRVVGIMRGYEGMIDADFIEMNSGSVSDIIHRGGTILKTARSARFRTVEGRVKAAENLRRFGIDGVVAIGGDGTCTGARIFHEEHGIPFVATPGTIDNDLFGTDYTIGYDTALNTAVNAIDKIRDTAASHNRLFFVEVMGRDAGFIALNSGIAGGAEAVLIPETKTDLDALIQLLETGWSRKKTSSIIVVSEGDEAGGAFAIADKVKARLSHFDTRVTVLGHIQRGGTPTCMDRVQASELGHAAVKALLAGKFNIMFGKMKGEISETPFDLAIKQHNPMNPNLLELVKVLSI